MSRSSSDARVLAAATCRTRTPRGQLSLVGFSAMIRSAYRAPRPRTTPELPPAKGRVRLLGPRLDPLTTTNPVSSAGRNTATYREVVAATSDWSKVTSEVVQI